MRKIAIILIACILSACMGREARVIPVYLPEDPYKDCATLATELRVIDMEMARLLKDSDKTAYNAVMGGAGIFLFVPLLFMDLSQAEREEAEAYRQRHNHLMILSQQKNCGFTGANFGRNSG